MNYTISFFWMLMILGPLKFTLWTFCNVNIFQKILHFYPTSKNGWLKHDFLVTLNVLVGVHERVENLLTRVGIRDLTFWGSLFCNFITCKIQKVLKICELQTHLYYILCKYNNFYTIGMYCCHSCVFCVFDTKKRRKNDNSGGGGGIQCLTHLIWKYC